MSSRRQVEEGACSMNWFGVPSVFGYVLKGSFYQFGFERRIGKSVTNSFYHFS